MKRIKKLASLLLAMIMVLSMGITAFATAPTDSTADGNTTAETGSFTITISDTTPGYVYNAYQIFSGDLNVVDGVKTLSNIEWGSGVDKEKVEAAFPGKTAAEVAAALAGTATENEFDTESATDFAAKIADCVSNVSTPSKAVTKGEAVEAYTISNLTAGYYLVLNTTVPATDSAYTRYMMEVVGDVAAVPKRGIPTPDKKIVEGTDKVETNEASIGDEVNYEITGTMPSNIADYKTYFYKFTDTLSKGLTYKVDSIRVTVNGVDVTDYFYKNVGTYNEETGTEIVVSIQDVKALSLLIDPAVGAITKDTTIVLRYTATLNENAVIAGEGNPNDVKLTYSNDPNKSGEGATEPPKENPEEPKPTHPTGESPKVEVVTYTTELTILKTDEENNFLPGVEFTLTGNGVNVVLVTEEKFEIAADGEYWLLKDGTYTKEAPQEEVRDPESDEVTTPSNEDDYASLTDKYKKTTEIIAKGNGKTETDVVGTVQEDGTVTFKGLGAGDYTITETKTLPGYNTIDPITFTLTFDATKSPMFASNNDKVTVGTDNMLDTSIVNQKGSLLPSTGGIGTTIFYVVGGILVIGAGILLVAKKRMSSK